MIRTASEHREALKRFQAEKKRFAGHRRHLKASGLSAAQVAKAMEPLETFHLQLADEIAAYESLVRNRIPNLHNLQGFGQLLVSLRIASGLTQRELARRLDIDETQVSRDERNEYHNVGMERAAKILAVLGADLTTTVRFSRPSSDAA